MQRIYVALPKEAVRKCMLKSKLAAMLDLTRLQLQDLASKTAGFSGSDITVLVKTLKMQALSMLKSAAFFR